MKTKSCRYEDGTMRKIAGAIGMCVALMAAPALVSAQDRPGAVAADVMETIIIVRAVDMDTRMVTVETLDGRLENIKVPPEAHNLYQVKPGDHFRVRFLQAVAINVLDPGGTPNADAVQVIERAPLGDTPGGAIVNTAQVTVKIERIDYDARTIIVRTPNDELKEYTVGPEVKRFNEVKVGDMVQLRITEALALKMVEP